jgi:hypothetical protein
LQIGEAYLEQFPGISSEVVEKSSVVETLVLAKPRSHYDFYAQIMDLPGVIEEIDGVEQDTKWLYDN